MPHATLTFLVYHIPPLSHYQIIPGTVPECATGKLSPLWGTHNLLSISAPFLLSGNVARLTSPTLACIVWRLRNLMPKLAGRVKLNGWWKMDVKWLQRLLRRALDTLGTLRVTILVVLIHLTTFTKCSVAGGVGILEVHGLGHSLGRGDVEKGRRRQNVAKSVEVGGVLSPVFLGELDSELDVEIAEVVVTVRRHALAANHLDGA